MKHWNWQTMWRTAAMTLAISGGAMTLPCGDALAKPRPERPGRSEEEAVEGKVKSMTTAPKGEVDGAVLEDGTVLHWPPHLEGRFSEVVSKGSRVRAVGRNEVSREGERRLEVMSLTNTDTRATAENDGRGPRGKKGKAPPPPPKRRGPARTVEGTIERFTEAPKGEIDGAVLRDGTVLHWPPHLEDGFAAVISKGDRVKATGFDETTRKGDEHFEIESLTNLDTNKSFENDDAAPRSEDRRAKSRAERDEHESRVDRIRLLKEEVRRLQREIERLEEE